MATSSFAERRSVTVRLPRVRGRLVVALLAAALLAGVAVAVVLSLTGDTTTQPDRYVDPAGGFSVSLPAGWRALPAAETKRLPTSPTAVLRRADGRAVVIVRRRGTQPVRWASVRRDLERQVRARFRGARAVGARTVALRSGAAHVFTFARPRAGTVQSIAVASLPGRTYTLDAVAAAGARDAATQLGALITSFDVARPGPRAPR